MLLLRGCRSLSACPQRPNYVCLGPRRQRPLVQLPSTPYFVPARHHGRKHSHRRHHQHTGSTDLDEVFVPAIKPAGTKVRTYDTSRRAVRALPGLRSQQPGLFPSLSPKPLVYTLRYNQLLLHPSVSPCRARGSGLLSCRLRHRVRHPFPHCRRPGIRRAPCIDWDTSYSNRSLAGRSTCCATCRATITSGEPAERRPGRRGASGRTPAAAGEFNHV